MPKARHEQVDQIGLEYLVGGIRLTDRYTVATLPPATAANSGFIVYVTNGAAGAAVLAYSNGAAWLRVDTNAAVAAA